jgi:hypothetical protein
MSKRPSAVFAADPELPVTVLGDSAGPKPAITGGLVHFRVESFLEGCALADIDTFRHGQIVWSGVVV